MLNIFDNSISIIAKPRSSGLIQEGLQTRKYIVNDILRRLFNPFAATGFQINHSRPVGQHHALGMSATPRQRSGRPGEAR
jgi:hypothetical protein